MNKRQLKCKVLKGMFSTERAIKCESQWGMFAAFVPRETTTGKLGEEGSVEVEVFSDNEDTLWAVIPNGHRQIIPVKEQQFLKT